MEKKMQSEQINELATALSKAQADIKPALKDSDNPFFKSKYADLAAVQTACMPHLTKNGLSVIQAINTVGGETFLVTKLMHTSGQWIESVAPVKPVKNDPQGLGSALTYMRRYSLAALVGVSQEDDDGNAANNNPKKPNLDMGYDAEQNIQSYEQNLAAIAGFSEVDKLESWFKANKNKLNKLPKDMYEDILAACATQKTDINSKLNGAH